MRAGTNALSVLAVPLNVEVLTALAEEPRPLIDLRRVVGSPPQTTMRKHLRSLTELGVLERRRQSEFPGSVDYELSRPGEELLTVATILQDWLARSPEGSLPLGTVGAKSVTKALIEGWSSTLVRALAARPLSLTELNRLISGLNYPSLERRLAAMRLAGLIKACPGRSRMRPYTATGWLRRGIAPIAAAASWERRNAVAASTPISRIDIESAFLLCVPMLRLSPELSGACRLTVESRNQSGEIGLAGVMVSMEEGRVTTCVARLQGRPDSWVSGSVNAWLGAVMDGENDPLEVGGDCELGRAILDELHGALFATARRA